MKWKSLQDLQGMKKHLAERERLARVLALSEEVAGAVGSDLMQRAMLLHDLLREAGRADGITALQKLGRYRR